MFLLISELKSEFFTIYKKLNLRTFSDNFSVLIKQINWSKKSLDQKRVKKEAFLIAYLCSNETLLCF